MGPEGLGNCDSGVVIGGGDQNDKQGQYGVVLGGPPAPCRQVTHHILVARTSRPTRGP